MTRGYPASEHSSARAQGRTDPPQPEVAQVLASPAPTSCLQAELLADLPAPGLLSEIARVKSFVELWLADGGAREAFLTDPNGVAGQHGVPATLADYLHGGQPLDQAEHPSLSGYGAYLRQRTLHREQMRAECAPADPAFAAWRERQMRRCAGQLPPHYGQAILHLPVAFELCQGCSVGCWFCGLSAASLESVFPASLSNRTLWRDVLEVVKELCGSAAGRGIAFWATDPLDNPDYELFCLDFHQILGRFPATTTALAAKHLGRVERLLELSWSHGCEFNRFSILSLGQIKSLRRHFSPEALLYVDLIAQTRSALRAKALAGKALEKGVGAPSAITSEPSTIACVSGFLVSMPGREVRLISPCEASPRWPMGYRVHGQARFRDASELQQAMRRMVEATMATELSVEQPLRLRPDVKASPVTGGRTAFHASYGQTMTLPLHSAILPQLAKGVQSAAHLALELEQRGVPMAETLHGLRRLFEQGWLDDEPEGPVHG